MDIGPTPEFREACRHILGGDDPATVLGAMRNDDPRMEDVRALHADLVEGKRTGHPSVMHQRNLTMQRLKAMSDRQLQLPLNPNQWSTGNGE